MGLLSGVALFKRKHLNIRILHRTPSPKQGANMISGFYTEHPVQNRGQIWCNMV